MEYPNTELKSLTEFAAAVKDVMQQYYPEAKVELRETGKNNGLKFLGLLIREGNAAIVPTIYLEPAYEEYKESIFDGCYDTAIENICHKLQLVYEQHRNPSIDAKELDYIFDFEQVKGKLIFTLVNKERNAELLEKVPHVDFLDLAYIFKLLVLNDEMGGAIVVTNELNKYWNKTAAELLEIAKSNQSSLCGDVLAENMKEMLKRHAKAGAKELGVSEAEYLATVDDLDIMPFITATNQAERQGAYAGFDKQLLRKVSRQYGNSNIAIMPSSIHECILLPIDAMEISIDDVKDMPRQVNATEVPEHEILSDNAYLYRASDETITIVEA